MSPEMVDALWKIGGWSLVANFVVGVLIFLGLKHYSITWLEGKFSERLEAFKGAQEREVRRLQST